MTIYSKGDIVLVPIDFTDFSGGKVRPAIVVSTDDYNQQCPDILIISVTSDLQAIPHPGDRVIADWQAAGLLAASLAQAKIATIDNGLVRRKLGELTPTNLANVEAGLREALGIPLAPAAVHAPAEE